MEAGTHIFEVQLGLSSDICVGVKRSLNAVSKASNIHREVRLSSPGCCISGWANSRRGAGGGEVAESELQHRRASVREVETQRGKPRRARL